MRALRADGTRRSNLMLGVALAVLVAWAVWFAVAPVAVYEVSRSGRLEVNQSVSKVAAPAQGRVVETSLKLGRMVEEGEVLLELDADAQRLELDTARARLAAIEPELEALEREVGVEREALERARDTQRAEVREERARHREGLAAAEYAEEQLARAERLRESGAASEAELSKARALARERGAAAETSAHAIARLEAEQRQRLSERGAKLEQLGRQFAQLVGERDTIDAQIKQLGYEIERRRVRAPIAGRLGDVADLQRGAVVSAGDVLATIVPDGRLRIVADYDPAAAVGRVAPGQPARLRLDGFPWTEYGSVSATVETVASEPRDGQIRVELVVDDEQSFRAPLSHGMTGTLEIRVETISPAAMALRSAGKLLGRSRREGP